MDTYLRLTPSEERRFRVQEEVMEIVTSWMEEGLQRGLQQELQQGRQTGMETLFDFSAIKDLNNWLSQANL